MATSETTSSSIFSFLLKDKIIGDNSYRLLNWLFTKKDYNEKTKAPH